MKLRRPVPLLAGLAIDSAFRRLEAKPSRRPCPPAGSPAVTGAKRTTPLIGIRAEPVDEENRQFQVATHVEVDSPASRAGLQVGDMLYTADGRGMPASFRDFAHWVQGRSVGDTVVLQFRRQSQYYRTEAVLEEFPRFDENGRREPSQSTNPDGR